ncbi:MAG TPA: ATPase, T2SS/T4P/T4SS family [Chthoniobacterales bacterium]
MSLASLLAAAETSAASDLLLHEGRPARLKIAREWREIEGDPVDAAILDEIWRETQAPADAREYDAALASPAYARFRVNCFRQLGKRGAALRRVRTEIPPMEELHLPADLLRAWLRRRSGVILVCGPTGSGKSTTLAACLSWLNRTSALHVVTLEDPVEFVFADQGCRFTQRELGIDTGSFAGGLRSALRQSPDAILIGEIRDSETTLSAMQAAETGHLILSTLHVNRAAEAVERLEYLAGDRDRPLLRALLAANLIGVICQRLIPANDGTTTAALEYFSNQGLVGKLLLEARTAELTDLVEQGDGREALSFNQSFRRLVSDGTLTAETALAHSPAPAELQRIFRGISGGSRG